MNSTDTVARQAIPSIPILQLGFRPFFLGAALFSIVSMLWWLAIYAFQVALPLKSLTAFQWHAHEMIFGYSLAVVAGFLLTAVGNWTRSAVLDSWPLLGLFALWAVPRALLLSGDAQLMIAAVSDLAFCALLLLVLVRPVVRTRQWRQAGLLSKVLLIGVANACFYLGCMGWLEEGVRIGLLLGLYLILGIILTLGRRVLPFFIEKGIGGEFRPRNSVWLDRASLLLFVGLLALEVFAPASDLMPPVATGLFAVTVTRLYNWYTPAIWRVPLLWSLFVAFAFIGIIRVA